MTPDQTPGARLPGSRARRSPAAFWLLAGLAFAQLVMPSKLAAKGEAFASKEYQIKAAFLFNFLQFVEWPDAAFTNSETPLSIGILGSDPFGPALEATIQGETIRNRKLTIQRSQRLGDLKNCHLIFICKSEKARLGELLAQLDIRQKLTVSEVEGFARQGGMINFYLEGNKVRFEINPASARREGLKLSSQLLSLGKIVESTPADKGP